MKLDVRRAAGLPLAAVTLVAGLAGCQRVEPVRSADRAPARSVGEVQPPRDTGVDRARDMAISTAIGAELARDSRSALRIHVDTRDGHVVLRGTAPDQTSRLRAAQLARATSGVRSVDNQLDIDAPK